MKSEIRIPECYDTKDCYLLYLMFRVTHSCMGCYYSHLTLTIAPTLYCATYFEYYGHYIDRDSTQ
jgi:hypothetical protein